MTSRFQSCQQATPHPVVAEARADLYTPLAVYLKLANAPYSYLLESVVGGERFGRYSFIGLACAERIEARGGGTVRRLLRDARGADVCLESVEADPFEYARAWLARHRVAPVPAALRFGGGLAGYFGYETVRHIEKSALKERKTRSARHARHAAARLRRARGGRQRARQALPRGVRRPAQPDADAHREGAARASARAAGGAVAGRALLSKSKSAERR